MPVSDSGRLIQPLSERAAKRRVSLGVSEGVARGTGKSPRKVSAGTTAHTL